MDPLTHSLLGAGFALQRAKKPKYMTQAIICGLLGGLAPDLDIVIRSASDPMFTLSYHRHFTHSLFFAPFGALLVSWLISKMVFRQTKFSTLYLFTLMGMASHGLLDSLTNYGTHFFWPLSQARESWNMISIVDPLFTIPLLIGVALSARQRIRLPTTIALLYCALYLGFSVVQKQAVIDQIHQTASLRGHKIDRMAYNPSLGNLIVWRGQYVSDGIVYADAYRVFPFTTPIRYDGESVSLFTPSAEFLETMGSLQAKDLTYFTFFTDGWLATMPGNPEIIGDLRFAILPNSTRPIWGIKFYPDHPTRHVDMVNTRLHKDGDAGQLWKMILGQPIKK